MPTRDEWDDIGRKLRAPFEPKDVDFRVQGNVGEQGKARVVAYIDARAVQDRLDAVVGVGDWSFDWTPLVVEKGDVQVAKGTLTIYGVSKSDAGSASNFEQSLGAVSHCFKRSAVHWGIGRYLYDLPAFYTTAEKGGRLTDVVLRELRAKLPRGESSAPAPRATQPAKAAPAMVNTLKDTPARAEDQQLLDQRLRDSGFRTARMVTDFIREHLDRQIQFMRLASGDSDITMGECSTLLLALNEMAAKREAREAKGA